MSEESSPGGQPGSGDKSHRFESRDQSASNIPVDSEEELDKNSSRRRRYIWIAAIVLVAIFIIYYLRGRGSPAGAQGTGAAGAKGGPQIAAASITAGQSKTGDINIYLTALGTVTPTYTVTVYSQITGQVMAVHYREGQMVRKGDPLVDIDPRPYQATVTQAEGTLQRDQGVLAQARMDLERYRAAYARNAIAKQILEDQEQAVVQDEGTVKADQGALAYDQVQLAYCHITAPISGQVGLRLVDAGNTVFSGSSNVLVVITQLQPITVVFNVSEDSLFQVKEQLSAGHMLSVDAFNRANDTLIESGMLTSLDNQVDTTTGTIKFRADFPNKKLALFPNQFINARLLVSTLHNVTLVPSAAVQHNGTAAFVYIVEPNNTVTVQPVTTLTSDEQVTAVQGLNPGLKLATSGFDRLENQAHVVVRERNTNSQGGSSQSGATNGQGGGSQSGGGSAR